MLLLLASNSPRFRFTLRSDLLGPLVLATDPLGWDTLGVNLHRDPKVHGLTTEYTVQLGFVKAGRAYLERAYQAAGIEADVRLSVELYDPNAFAWLPYYAGRINFTSRELTRLAFKANVENEDFTQKFLNRDAVQVDLLGNTSVGGSVGPTAPPVVVPMHSRVLVKRYDASVPAEYMLGAGAMFGNEDDPSREQVLYFGFNDETLNEVGLGAVAGGFVAGDAASAAPIYVAKENGEFTFELALDVDIEAHGDAGPYFEQVDAVCHFRINGSPGSAMRLQPDISVGNLLGDYTGTIEVAPLTITVNLEIGDEVFLYATYYVHEVGGIATGIRYRATINATMQPGSYLRIRSRSSTPATPAAGLLLYEAYDRVCQALTDEPDAFRSTYFGRPDTRQPQPLDGPGALRLLTSGFQLRGFPLPSAPAPAAGGTDARKSIYASWRDLFDATDATDCLGYGIERTAAGKPVVRVEDAGYFYPTRVVLDLTAGGPGQGAGEVTTKTLPDRFYQNLEFGYAQWQAEQVNGLDEVNAQRQWTTPLTQSAGTYSQLSKYTASGQLLEVTRRRRFVDSDTTDNRSDNNNFFVCLLRSAPGSSDFVTERNQLFSRLDGVLDPDSIYNARLTPARNLRRHGFLLRAGLEPAGTRRIRFAFGQGNNEVVSQLVGEAAPVAEKADIAVSELAAPRWRPESDAFTAPVSRPQLQHLLADPVGRIRYFGNDGQPREGWILDFKHDAAQLLGTFELLRCVD